MEAPRASPALRASNFIVIVVSTGLPDQSGVAEGQLSVVYRPLSFARRPQMVGAQVKQQSHTAGETQHPS